MISTKIDQIPIKKAKRGNPKIREIGHETRIKPGQRLNPLGMPKIKTHACYWAAKYSQFTLDEIKKEIAKTNLKAIQIAVLRDWQQMVKNPTDANFAWARLKDQYERDEPIDNGPPVQDINITIIKV